MVLITFLTKSHEPQGQGLGLESCRASGRSPGGPKARNGSTHDLLAVRRAMACTLGGTKRQRQDDIDRALQGSYLRVAWRDHSGRHMLQGC